MTIRIAPAPASIVLPNRSTLKRIDALFDIEPDRNREQLIDATSRA
jgi:hypothetical protein